MKSLMVLVVLALDAGQLRSDAGQPLSGVAVRAEDQEVIEHLELLEHLDETTDFDLLQELSVER